MKRFHTLKNNGTNRVKPDLYFSSSGIANYQIPICSIVPFLLITFGIAWTILGLYIFLPERMTGIFGEVTGEHPLFFLAVYAPAIAAFAIVLYNAGRQCMTLQTASDLFKSVITNES